MLLDFKYGWCAIEGTAEEYYDDEDLRYGIAYMEDLLAQGYAKEPMDKINLLEFIAWASRKLEVKK